MDPRSVRFVLKLHSLPSLPPLPSETKISKQNTHGTWVHVHTPNPLSSTTIDYSGQIFKSSRAPTPCLQSDVAVHLVNRPEEQPVHHGPVGVRDPPHLPDALELSGRRRLPIEQTHEMSGGVQVGSKSEAESRKSLLGLQTGCPKKSPLTAGAH